MDDEDHDGAHDIFDNCVQVANIQSDNLDGDNWGDSCDNCPSTANSTQLDADGNGMISSEEAAADPMLVEEWATIDVNNDGQLERAEFSALEEKSKPEMSK